MLNGRRILAVVPARGGSKGIPMKNLRELDGVPLVGHVGRLVQSLTWIDRAVVSTDSDEIAKVAAHWGLDAPFRRPADLSGDRIGDIPVLQHALAQIEMIDACRYDIVVMLQPTAPLRTARHVQETVEKLTQENCDAAWTVSPTDLKYHPLKQLRIDGGRLALWDPDGAAIIARQQLWPVYHRNGAAYALTRRCLMEIGTLLGERAAAVIIDEPMISVDTEDDLRRAEEEMARRKGPGRGN
jgi:CMP-N,N'-diacetyllegionaminic acid synthase